MKNIPLISICIPTYNREKYLQECLDSMVVQDGFNEDDIEIFISDNASIDNTKEVVKGYQEKYSNIRYHRNDTNVGADRNVIKVLQCGTGQYLWGISDDDILLPGALSIIKSHLLDAKNKDIWFVQTNFNVLDDLTKSFSREKYISSKNGTKVFESMHELYGSYNYCHNGLSFFSIDIFSSKIHQFDLGSIPITQYPHSCIMGLISYKKAMFIDLNAIGFRQNNSSAVENAKDFFRIFVINHLQYMAYLRKIKSSISQFRLLVILIKMLIYSGYLFIKLHMKDMYKKFKEV